MYCNLNDDVECGCDRDRQDDGRFVCKVLIKKTGRKQKEVFGPRKKTKKEEYKKNHTQVIFVHWLCHRLPPHNLFYTTPAVSVVGGERSLLGLFQK